MNRSRCSILVAALVGVAVGYLMQPTSDSKAVAADEIGEKVPWYKEVGVQRRLRLPFCLAEDCIVPSGTYFIDEMIGVVAAAPEWPEDRQLTQEEWRELIEIAIALQHSDPRGVESLIVSSQIVMKYYEPRSDERMQRHWRTQPEQIEREKNQSWNSLEGKYMLLFRIMFEIPEGVTYRMLEKQKQDVDEWLPSPCNSITSHACNPGEEASVG